MMMVIVVPQLLQPTLMPHVIQILVVLADVMVVTLNIGVLVQETLMELIARLSKLVVLVPNV